MSDNSFIPPDPEQARAHVASLADAFRGSNRAQNESDTRQNFIDPLLLALGWPVGKQPGIPARDKDVDVEAITDAPGIRNKRPDYLLRVGGYNKLVIEAKKPDVNLKEDRDAIFQAKSYAWSLQVPFTILTDFEEWRVFDATIKPRHDEPQRGLVRDFDLSYTDYAEQFDVLLETFGRAAVENGSLEELLRKVKKVPRNRRIRGVDNLLLDLKGADPVDRDFLEFLEGYRLRIAKQLFAENRRAFPDAGSAAGNAKLAEAAQRVLDRLVFIRVCEDRNVEHYGTLRELINEARDEDVDPYSRLVNYFRHLDRQYNGYLFKEHFTEHLKLDAHLLSDLVSDLYPPTSAYRFDAIRDDLLGIVYERFLGHAITVSPKGVVEAEEKPAVRHANGVYYTPGFVVDAIIRRTLGVLVEGKSPADIVHPKTGIKTLDPACGSGSFLIAAYGYLMDHCRSYLSQHPDQATIGGTSATGKKRTIAYQDDEGEWHLSPDFRGELLQQCIFGVDIDQQAVEVSVMSLYLKLLEDRLPPNEQRELYAAKLLPPLSGNIACGNALLSQSDFDQWWIDQNGGLFDGDADLRFRLNAFDWNSRTRGFGDVMEQRGPKHNGFDAVIGNPPYIRVQELQQWAPEESAFYKWKYKSAARGNYDIYVCFIEKGLALLSKDGRMGYICPHKYWQADYGESLRKVIVNGKHLREVIDFADQQVFRGATTYTAIHIMTQHAVTGPPTYAKVFDLQDGDEQIRQLVHGVIADGVASFEPAEPAETGHWNFLPKVIRTLLDDLLNGNPSLFPDVCESVFQGIITGADTVFLNEVTDSNDDGSRFVSESDECFDIESELLVDVVRRQGFDLYDAVPTHRLLLPYDRTQAKLYSEKEMRDRFPQAWEYLSKHRVQLSQRDRGRLRTEWWNLSRPQNIERWCDRKLLLPYMINRLMAAPGDDGIFFVNVTTGGYGIAVKPTVFGGLKDAEGYMLGLLNSLLLDFCLRNLSNHFGGGYFPANKQFVRRLPIKLPATAAERKLADEVATRARRIVAAKARLRREETSLGDRERSGLLSQAAADEDAINTLTCKLYGIDPAELAALH